jgi:hypothetical protein
MIGFFRKQEERLAEQFIRRHYEKKGFAVPDDITLSLQAAQIVAEAHAIAKKRGQNVLAIFKELAEDLITDLKRR